MKKGLLVALCLVVLAVFVVQIDVAQAQKQKVIVFKNATQSVAQVYVNFGAESKVNRDTFSQICNLRRTPSNLNCSFDLKPGESQTLDPKGQQINLAAAFNKVVDCGSTKAELSANMPNPKQDTFDVSVVDGFNEKITATFNNIVLGPPCGQVGNERAYGVFPLGCTKCALGRTLAPCAGAKTDPSRDAQGCKTGTESNPSVLCQYNFNNMTEANGTVTFTLVPQSTPCLNK